MFALTWRCDGSEGIKWYLRGIQDDGSFYGEVRFHSADPIRCKAISVSGQLTQAESKRLAVLAAIIRRQPPPLEVGPHFAALFERLSPTNAGDVRRLFEYHPDAEADSEPSRAFVELARLFERHLAPFYGKVVEPRVAPAVASSNENRAQIAANELSNRRPSNQHGPIHPETDFNADAYLVAFRRDGYFIREDVVPLDETERLRGAIAALPNREEIRRKRSVYGIRNLLEICPEVRGLVAMPAVRQFAAAILGERAFAVRAIFFDKVADANWSLFWHQDNVIAVKERRDVPGFVGWSQKAGVWQVQPPADVLANMVAVRVHLDDCGPTNGPLRVLPGSHCHGWLDDELDDWKQRVPEVVCTVGRGGIVAMCPLILHASAPSEAASHRRVIHIEYAAADLSDGLDWNNRVGPASRDADDRNAYQGGGWKQDHG